MGRLRFLTAGESHGACLVGILEGMPAGLILEASYIDAHLARRQAGHGRGARQKIERDAVRILSGVRHGLTIGSPVALMIENRDAANWKDVMRVEPGGDPALKSVSVPRPGHADYQGAVKYGLSDIRSVFERASARETAMRVALGSVARRFLEEFGIAVGSRVVAIGPVEEGDLRAEAIPVSGWNEAADRSPVRCLDREASERMVAAIDAAKASGDSLGGIFEVRASGLPVGLGSHVQWDRRLEGELARALMSLNAVKGLEIGQGFSAAREPGSRVHDEIVWDEGHGVAVRATNRSGGIDGGMTTGRDLVVRAAVKPIATLMKPLASVDLATGRAVAAHVERSDTCAVPAAAVIGESLVALVLADAFLEKYGGDSLVEVRAHYEVSRKA